MEPLPRAFHGARFAHVDSGEGGQTLILAREKAPDGDTKARSPPATQLTLNAAGFWGWGGVGFVF